MNRINACSTLTYLINSNARHHTPSKKNHANQTLGQMEVEPVELLVPPQLIKYFHVVEAFGEALRMKRGLIVFPLAPHLIPLSERAWQWVLDALTVTEILERRNINENGGWRNRALKEMDPDELTALLVLLDFYDVPMIQPLIIPVLVNRLDQLELGIVPMLEPSSKASAINRVLHKEIAWRHALKEWLQRHLKSLDLVERVRGYRPLLGPLVAPGGAHTLFLTYDGVWGCGSNSAGQLGMGKDKKVFLRPTLLTNAPPHVVQITCGLNHSAVVTRLGELWMCGSNGQGQMAQAPKSDGEYMPRWYRVTVLPAPVKEVACGNFHTLVLLGDGRVFVCGSNADGQLGQSHHDAINGWFHVKLPQSAHRIACGGRHNAILTADGLWTFGSNAEGQLGRAGTRDDGSNATPTLVPNLSTGIRLFACGQDHTVVAFRKGVWGWGGNDREQLFMTADGAKHQPGPILGPDIRASDLTCGSRHTIFVNRGQLVFSGSNTLGQTALNSITEPAQEVFAGANTSFVLTERGLWACGSNRDGELGLGKHENAFVPVLVPIVFEPQRSEEKRLEKEEEIDQDRVTQKRRLGELCTVCDKKWRSIEPMQYRYKFCGPECYKSYFTPHK